MKYLLIFSMLLFVSCTGKPVQVTPAAITSYSSSLLSGATKIQQLTTAAVKANPNYKSVGDKITGFNEKILAESKKLEKLLPLYNTATSLELKDKTATEILASLDEIRKNLDGEFELPASDEIGQTITNLIQLSNAVTLEIRKFKNTLGVKAS